MRIGIVGAGVAGASLAEKLARQGHEVWLFDPRAPWEKPCGGGITPRAVVNYPEWSALPLARHEIKEVSFIGPTGRRLLLSMRERWHTVSRRELAQVLLQRAQSAGVSFLRQRVQRVFAVGGTSGFQMETAAGTFQVEFLVGADGVTGVTRRNLVGKWGPLDLCRCYGFLLPREAELPLTIRFYPDLMGYAWLFPRPGNLFSAGIAASGTRLGRDALVQRLKQLITTELEKTGRPAPRFPKPYAALLPSLSAEGFAQAQVGGPNWALVGDASGAVDPVTGEGISYAFQTAALLADAIREDQGRSYAERWRKMAEPGIGHAGRRHWRERFYRPRVLWLYSLALRHSGQVQELTRELFSGRQSYHDLKARVWRSAPRALGQILWSLVALRGAG